MNMDDIFSQFGDIFGGGGVALVVLEVVDASVKQESKEVICEFV